MKSVLCIAIILILYSCNSPKTNMMIGKWQNEDGALFNLKSDGTFVADSLSPKYFAFPGSINPESKLKGTGNWLLKNNDGIWEVTLRFNKNVDFKKGYDTQLQVDEIENNKWCLFAYEDEEGGERYVYFKK